MSDCHVDSCFAGPGSTRNWAEQHSVGTSGCSKLFYLLWHFLCLPRACYFRGWPLEALPASPTQRVMLSFLIQMSSSALSILFYPTCQGITLHKFCSSSCYSPVDPEFSSQRTSGPDVQSLDACASGMTGSRWNLPGDETEWKEPGSLETSLEGDAGTLVSSCVSLIGEDWKCPLLPHLPLWHPAASMRGSDTMKKWPQTKPSKLKIYIFDSLVSHHSGGKLRKSWNASFYGL